MDGTSLQTPLPALPIEFGGDAARFGIAMQPPRLGQHSLEILDELGFAPDVAASLVDSRVVRALGEH